MDTIKLGSATITLPPAVVTLATLFPAVADLLATPVGAGEPTRSFEDQTLGLSGERNAVELEIIVRIADEMSLWISAEEESGDEVAIVLRYVGKDGAVVDRIEEVCGKDGTFGDIAPFPDALAVLAALPTGFFDESYDRSDRSYTVTVDVE